jgi:hypothetical protein
MILKYAPGKRGPTKFCSSFSSITGSNGGSTSISGGGEEPGPLVGYKFVGSEREKRTQKYLEFTASISPKIFHVVGSNHDTTRAFAKKVIVSAEDEVFVKATAVLVLLAPGTFRRLEL